MSTTDTAVNATPAAVELAKVNDVDLADVEGTGTEGKVTVDDVRSYIEESGEEVIPVDQATIDSLRDAATPTGGDIDIRDIPKAQPSEDELGPVILAGYWVKLGDVPKAEPAAGQDPEDVPDYSGSYGFVIEGPWTSVPFANDSEETLRGYRYDEEKDYLVKTRGSGEAIIEVPADSIEFYSDGRAGLFGHA